MCRPSYIQQPIAALPPAGVTPAETVRFNVFFGVEDGRVALRYEQGKSGGQDYIAINRDSLVEIVLQGEQLYLSKDMDAVTTKDELAAFYGGLEYDGYDEKLDRYRIVRFTARYNRGGRYDTTHGFNINVDLLQDAGAGSGPRWIAMTIDPDIKNPPPKLTHS